MANNMNEDLEAEGSRADHALRIKTPAGTEISTNDKWIARIIVTTAGVAGIVAVGGVTKFCLDQPQVVEKAVEVALKIWGEVSRIKFGSVIIELDCGSEEKLLQFLDDFENGNVQAALEKEFRERGYNSEQDLLVTLDIKALPKAILIRRTMHSITEEKVTVQNLNPFVTAVEKDRKYMPECGADIQRNPIDGPSYLPPQRQKGDDQEPPGHASQQPLTSGSSSSQTEWPSDKELQQIANRIASHWEEIGIFLGIPNDQIQRIKLRGKEAPFQMLVAWKKNIKCVHPYKTLYDALCSEGVDLSNVADEFLLGKI